MLMNLTMKRGNSLVEYLSLHVRRNFKSPGCSTRYTYMECFTTSVPLHKVGAPGEVVLSFIIYNSKTYRMWRGNQQSRPCYMVSIRIEVGDIMNFFNFSLYWAE